MSKFNLHLFSPWRRRGLLRTGFLLVILCSSAFLGISFAASTYVSDTVDRSASTKGAFISNETTSVWDGTDPSNVTVIAGQNTPFADSKLVAVDNAGTVLYFNKTYDIYYDVDPSPKGRWTVLYTATIHLNRSECHASTKCRRNVVERLNMSTGELTQLYSQTVPYYPKIVTKRQNLGPVELARTYLPQSFSVTARWHDVDRIGESRLLVGDIGRNRVYIVNTSTGIITWEWQAQNAFPIAGGGDYPYDWTHLNDVELLENGRIMVSLRNQDQVVFIDRHDGLAKNWTLGGEDDHKVLYEQHNPDYIPREHGGPAVIVADSQNDRIVEYQRQNRSWTQSWVWQDSRLSWPRDADRLPTGHTLIVDTGGDRVLEIDESGTAVWSVKVRSPYDAERLVTGDESTGGPSAVKADLVGRDRSSEGAQSTTTRETGTSNPDTVDKIRLFVKSLVPTKLQNALIFILPRWIDFYEFVSLLALLGSSIAWSSIEYYWSDQKLKLQSPVGLE